CPPTAAQINKGVTCVIGLGDLAGHTGKSTIPFAGQAAPTTTTTAGPTTTAAPTTPTAKPAPTTTTVAAGGTATTTTLAASVLGTQTTNTSGATLPRTGLPRHLVLMAVIGVAVLDLGYLVESSTRPARRLRER